MSNPTGAVLSLLLSSVACTSGGRGEPASEAHPHAVAVGSTTSAPVETCPLDFSLLASQAPRAIPLKPWRLSGGSTPRPVPDDCPPDFDADALLATSGCSAPDCLTGELGTRRVALRLDGPGGSGHFWSLGLAVADGTTSRYVCMTASTVGSRYLENMHDQVGTLPWLTEDALVVWNRLPWGPIQSELQNALAPIAYELDDGVLIMNNSRAHTIARRLAAIYRGHTAGDRRCDRAIAEALDHWGEGQLGR